METIRCVSARAILSFPPRDSFVIIRLSRDAFSFSTFPSYGCPFASQIQIHRDVSPRFGHSQIRERAYRMRPNYRI